MIVYELMEQLKRFDPEAEVRLAYQQSYPLQDHVRGAVQSQEADELAAPLVWIVSGGQVYDTPYGPELRLRGQVARAARPEARESSPTGSLTWSTRRPTLPGRVSLRSVSLPWLRRYPAADRRAWCCASARGPSTRSPSGAETDAPEPFFPDRTGPRNELSI